jgi:transposase
MSIKRVAEPIISRCHPDHKVTLRFLEGLNNKIRRVTWCRAYGIKDQEYLIFKIITSFINEPK